MIIHIIGITGVAQSVERYTFILLVVGSKPIIGIFLFFVNLTRIILHHTYHHHHQYQHQPIIFLVHIIPSPY